MKKSKYHECEAINKSESVSVEKIEQLEQSKITKDWGS